MIKNIQIKIINRAFCQKFGLPTYETQGAAALDLRACLEAPLELRANEVALIPTGIALYIADPQVAAMVLPRSGLGHKHGVVLGNLTGLIDSDYQGQVMISCWNRGLSSWHLQPGDRIAQCVFVPVIKAQWSVVEEFADQSLRGGGGFGHTGQG